MSQNTDPTPESPRDDEPVVVEAESAEVTAVDGSDTAREPVVVTETDPVGPEPAVDLGEDSASGRDAGDAHAAPELVEPVTPQPVFAEPMHAEPHPIEPMHAEPVVAAPAAAVAAPTAPPAPASAAGHVAAQPIAPREVVYVQAPSAPKPRSNRGFGVLIAVIGALVFALLYIATGAVVIGLTPGVDVETTVTAFAGSAAFWVPVGVYLVLSVLFVLMANRASWWVHVLGSLFVALLTYAVSVGVLALMYNVVAMTQEEGLAQILSIASSPFVIAAAVLARECALWFGLAIAARGRRVRERNAAEREAFDAEVAEQRAAYERAYPA